MQEIWGRRIVWSGTHRPPNPPPPNTSTTLETPSSSLVMDDQTVYWLIGLFPWLMVRIRMRRPSMLHPTLHSQKNVRVSKKIYKTLDHGFCYGKLIQKNVLSLLTSITPNVQWDEEEWSQRRRQKDEWSRRSSNQPNKRSKLKYQSQPPHSPTY